MKIAILGAESTGKTRLANELAILLHAQRRIVNIIPEVLRQWCESHGRTPRREEQMSIAYEQARLLDLAEFPDVVISDTTPLMTAIYSDWLFSDCSLYDFAISHQRLYDLTLVLGLDTPWVADTHLRDGPHSREPVDALLRQCLEQASLPYTAVYGLEQLRAQHAMAAVLPFLCCTSTAFTHISSRSESGEKMPGWRCLDCDDPDCEHTLFQALLNNPLLQ